MTKKISVSFICLLIAFAFSLSTNALSLSYKTYDGNIFKLDYFKLIEQFPELEGKVNPDSWPNQQEPDIEAEVGDPFPDFGSTPFLISVHPRK